MSSTHTASEATAETSDKQALNSEGTSQQRAKDANQSSAEDLRGQIELLQAENQRLRQEYVRARQTAYRRTALGLGAVGVLALGSSVFFPGSREVLLALGGSALIAGILTYYLTPEEFVTAAVGETVAQTLQETYSELQSELNLQGNPVYIPLTDTGGAATRLFLPQHHEHALPSEDQLQQTFVVPEEAHKRGVAVRPSGAGLFKEFQAAADLPTATTSDPERVFEQLADGLVEQFEVADQVTTTVEAETRCVVAVTGSTYGTPEQVDHPIASFIAVGAATAFTEPVRIAVQTNETEDFVLECRWGADAGSNA